MLTGISIFLNYPARSVEMLTVVLRSAISKILEFLIHENREVPWFFSCELRGVISSQPLDVLNNYLKKIIHLSMGRQGTDASFT